MAFQGDKFKDNGPAGREAYKQITQVDGTNVSVPYVAVHADLGFTSSGGGGGAATIADGADVAQGTTTDAAYSSGAGTVVAVLKGIFGRLAGLPSAKGQQTMANSTGVVIASDQSALTTNGNVGGYGNKLSANPTISTSAYVSGYNVGAILTLANAVKTAGTGVIQDVTIIDTSNQKAALDIFFFDRNPGNGTYTDHAAFTLNASDAVNCLGKVSIATSDYAGGASGSAVATKAAGIQVKANSGTSLYALIQTNGTPTYGSTALTLKLGMLQD